MINPLSNTLAEQSSRFQDEVSASEFIDVVLRRRRLILVTAVIMLIIGILYSLLPQKYKASGTILIQPGAGAAYRTSPLSLISGADSSKITSEVTVIQSRTLYLDIARDLNLANEPSFWGKKSLKKKQSLEDPAVREQVFRQMRSAIKISHNPKDEIIGIECTTIAPALSAKITNSLINHFVEYLFRMRSGSSQRAAGWLIGQLDDLKKQIEHDQAMLVDLQFKLGVVGLNEKTADALSVESLGALTKASTTATIERIIAEAKLRDIENADLGLIEGEINPLTNMNGMSGPNGLLQNLRNSEAQLSSEYASLLSQYGPNYPEVIRTKSKLDEITRQVSTEEKRILNQARLSYSSAMSNEQMTNLALAKEKDLVFNAKDDIAKYLILLTDYQSHRALYEGLVLRLREASITSGMEAGEVDIVDLADLPAFPSSPGRIIIIAAALISGLLLGVVACFVAEALKTKLSTVEQAERVSQMPLFGMLPHFDINANRKANPDAKFFEISPVNSRYSEAVHSLRTAVLLSQTNQSSKSILITSSTSGEGKSTVSLNLAAAFAEHDEKVVLIDCDLRRGSLAQRMGVTNKQGLSSVLSGTASLDAVLTKLSLSESFYILPSGPFPPNPGVLLDSPQMKNLIDECREQFDVVILDCPPILGISDTMNLCRLVETRLIVIRRDVASNKGVQHLRRMLDTGGLPPTGFIFNDVESIGRVYGEGYNAYYAATEESQEDTL